MKVLTFGYPIARKTHTCAVCGWEISIGTKHHFQTSVYDGVFHSWRTHSDCAEMHWKHNGGRSSDDQTDDYLRMGYEKFWPEAIHRIKSRSVAARLPEGA